MIQLKKVILQLSDEHYMGLLDQFQKNRAEKYFLLMQYAREAKLEEEEISEKLGLNKTAYYTLKSRLYEKIQQYLFEHVKDPRIELMGNVANIHNLLFNSPKETSIAILKKLEKKLLELDMPNELILIYDALKKLHLSSPKHYEYTQLYNKHVAYTLGLDKAEDLLSKFTKSIGEYLMSRDGTIIEVLLLMKAQMANVFNLYESHHLAIYRNIMNISFALFIPEHEANPEEESVEGMLKASVKIFDENPRDINYGYLRTIFDFLAFEYYHGLRLFKNAAPYFESVNEQLDTFFLADHCCMVTYFLSSKVERYLKMGIAATLVEENVLLTHEFLEEDVPNYVFLSMYKASSFFYAGNYPETVSTLKSLLRAIKFKNILHAEVEVKLFLALNYSMINQYDKAEILIKSVSRKLGEKTGENYDSTQIFIRILRMQMSADQKDVDSKIRILYDQFMLKNKGKNRILRFLKFDKPFIAELSRYTKRSPQAKLHRDASV
jgi:hypothetical protein